MWQRRALALCQGSFAILGITSLALRAVVCFLLRSMLGDGGFPFPGASYFQSLIGIPEALSVSSRGVQTGGTGGGAGGDGTQI